MTRSDMNNIIEIKDLKKHFKEVKAVDGISFCVKEGELFAFLGLNGAGKSTTINKPIGERRRRSVYRRIVHRWQYAKDKADTWSGLSRKFFGRQVIRI